MANCNWKPKAVEEINTFIAIYILMGIHTLLEQRNCWSSDKHTGVAAVAKINTKTSFKKLTENIHCNGNTKAVPRIKLATIVFTNFDR